MNHSIRPGSLFNPGSRVPAGSGNSDKVVVAVLRALVNIIVSVFDTGSIKIACKH